MNSGANAGLVYSAHFVKSVKVTAFVIMDKIDFKSNNFPVRIRKK